MLGHRSLETVSLNYDGTVLLILNLCRIISRIDVKKGENIGIIELDEEIRSLSFIPDETKILVSFRSKSVIYDSSTYQTTDIYKYSLGGLFCFSPINANLFISRDQFELNIYDVEFNNKYSKQSNCHSNKIFNYDGTKIISFYEKNYFNT